MAQAPKLKTTTKGAPPPKTATRENLDKPDDGKSIPLNFKVTAEFRRDFRVYAAMHDLSLTEVLYRAFEALRR